MAPCALIETPAQDSMEREDATVRSQMTARKKRSKHTTQKLLPPGEIDPDLMGSGVKGSTYQKAKATAKYFVGLGVSEQVPIFLRYTGRLRNRHLSKKDVELVVRECWDKKMKHDKERGCMDMNLRYVSSSLHFSVFNGELLLFTVEV